MPHASGSLDGKAPDLSPRESGFWRDRPTLVTGSTGFLGSWLTAELVRRGANVVCLIRDWIPQSELLRTKTLDRVSIVRGDIRDREAVERLLGEYEIDTVFHLAAQAIVSVANRNPLETFETNIAGTWRVLEACRRSPNVKQVIFASSDKAYGDQPNLPYHEKMSLAGVNPYDVSKSCADLLASSYAATYGVPLATTRCANLFGGGDLNFNRIVPGTIRSILRGNAPVIRSDGKFVRDYLYVEDAVEGYLTLAEQLAARRSLSGEAFNFSNELRLSVGDLVAQILRIMDSPLEPVIQNKAVAEVREAYVASRKAHAVLGWKPSLSLDDALRRTVSWYRSFLATSGDVV